MTTPRVPTEPETRHADAPIEHSQASASTAPETTHVGQRSADTHADAVAAERADAAERAAAAERADAAERAEVNEEPVGDPRLENREIVQRQRERFGGVKVGSAFFGWLAATGTAALLTGLLAAIGAAIGTDVLEDPLSTAVDAGLPADAVGWVGAAAVLVLLFVSYYCGGYVAGRMARFNGFVQGLAVWVWALVMAIVVALVGVGVGSRYDVFNELGALPRLPISDGELTVAGLIAAVVIAVASLGGAVLGGKAGTRYHRKVDRAALDA